MKTQTESVEGVKKMFVRAAVPQQITFCIFSSKEFTVSPENVSKQTLRSSLVVFEVWCALVGKNKTLLKGYLWADSYLIVFLCMLYFTGGKISI